MQKASLRQRRFPHRQQLIRPRSENEIVNKKQSTLTQLNFVSTPPPEYDSDASYESDFVPDSPRPPKRRKTQRNDDSTNSKNSTLTQIGFVDRAPDSDALDAEVIADSQRAPDLEDSPIRRKPSEDEQAVICLSSSPLPQPGSQASLSWFTPKTTNRVEAPSSQTPLSVALSSIRRAGSDLPGNRSPLAKLSTNILPDPSVLKLDHFTTIQDSDEDSDNDHEDGNLLQPNLHTTQNSSAVRIESTYVTAESLLGRGPSTLQEQCTYDPAARALDRDAARAAWTQNQAVRPTVEDTYSDDEEISLHVGLEIVREDEARVAATPTKQFSNPAATLRQSQISTVVPTQESPPPLFFTSASSDPLQDQMRPETAETPVLPMPPWARSQASLHVDRTDQNITARKDLTGSTLPDFSLPPPPPLQDWSSSQVSIRRADSKE